jgi:hypothetical protein
MDRFSVGLPDPQEKKVVGECLGCGGEVYAGESVWIIDGDMLHQCDECAVKYVESNSCEKVAE